MSRSVQLPPRASRQTGKGLSRLSGARCDEQVDSTLRIHLPGASHGRQGRRDVPHVIPQLLPPATGIPSAGSIWSSFPTS